MYEDVTPESIEAEILAGITKFDTREGSFARTLISPAAYEIWKGYTALEGVPDMIFVTEQSGQYIDKKAADFGLVRKPGAKASGSITLNGRSGTVVPAGKIFLTPDGLGFTLDEQTVIPQAAAPRGASPPRRWGRGTMWGRGRLPSSSLRLRGSPPFPAGRLPAGWMRRPTRSWSSGTTTTSASPRPRATSTSTSSGRNR